MKEFLEMIFGFDANDLSQRRDAEPSFTISKSTPGCGTLLFTCSHRGKKPIEIFVHTQELNYQRQDTCGWALKGMGRSISLMLQEGIDPAKVAEITTKEPCPVWSEGTGHLTCPVHIRKLLLGMKE